MSLDREKKRISNYLQSDKNWPIIVDLQTRADLEELKDYFQIGENKILSAEKFCGKDETFKRDELYNAIKNNSGNTIIVGITSFLKIYGEEYMREVFRKLVFENVSGHVVVFTYQCRNYLKFSDPRIAEKGQIIIAQGEPDSCPNICLISPELSDAFEDSYIGFDNICYAVEHDDSNTIYIATDVKKESFPNSLITISQMTNGYDILCNRDSRTKMVPQSYGTSEKWNYALKEIGYDGDWASVIRKHFISTGNLDNSIKSYQSFSDDKKWLYFIAMSIFGVKDNAYLQMSVQNAYEYTDLVKSIYRTILTVDRKSPEFESLFIQRKALLMDLSDTISEAVEFCKVISVKEKDCIYYLTDLSRPEKERVIAWLDVYGSDYDPLSLIRILKPVYPDLAAYLSTYRFKNELLDSYFAQYKYQKVINKILPSFETIVDEQSTTFGFVDALQSRTTLAENIDVADAHAYFVDALGVEYLGFIQEKCNQYGLTANIQCARCELPSLTMFNKEFIPTFTGKGCPVSDIKGLDEIKHHGEDSYDYEKVKIPVYLTRELEIIDELLQTIKANLYSESYSKGIIISDHGASRLAVLHNTENIWQMATNGVHSGRCCPANELDDKPDFAIEKENYWVLANYDRFKGGRKANCEVHGGATLEEVAIPIIEITKKQTHIEAFILDESKTVTLGAKEFAKIKIYVGIKSNNICVKIEGNYYDAQPTSDAYVYSVALEDYSKKGKYTLDIINGTDTIASRQPFEIKKKGLAENNLFG